MEEVRERTKKMAAIGLLQRVWCRNKSTEVMERLSKSIVLPNLTSVSRSQVRNITKCMDKHSRDKLPEVSM